MRIGCGTERPTAGSDQGETPDVEPASFYTGIVAELYGPLRSSHQDAEPYARFIEEDRDEGARTQRTTLRYERRSGAAHTVVDRVWGVALVLPGRAPSARVISGVRTVEVLARRSWCWSCQVVPMSGLASGPNCSFPP